MNIIAPLAGPDFEMANGSVKAEHDLNGRPLLRAALESRPWWRAEMHDLIFVLRDRPVSRRFAETRLASWYPSAKSVWLSDGANGAALSAAAGVALIADPDQPVIVDLCDILFQSDLDPGRRFADDPLLGGLAVTFESTSPRYSYLRLAPDGSMLEAREKAVISQHASAGVYIFRNASIFWGALAHSLANRSALAHKGALFVCPMLNGVVAQGFSVRASPAVDIVDLKIEPVREAAV